MTPRRFLKMLEDGTVILSAKVAPPKFGDKEIGGKILVVSREPSALRKAAAAFKRKRKK